MVKSKKLLLISFILIILAFPLELIKTHVLGFYLFDLFLFDFLILLVMPLLGIIFGFMALEQFADENNKKWRNISIFAPILGFIAILTIFIILGIFIRPGDVPDQCVSTAGIGCKSYEISLTHNYVSLSFINNLGKAITISKVNITYKGVIIAQCNDVSNIVDINGVTIVTNNTAGLGGTINSVMPESIFMFNKCNLTANIIQGKNVGDILKLDFRYDYIINEPGEFTHTGSGTVTDTAR